MITTQKMPNNAMPVQNASFQNTANQNSANPSHQNPPLQNSTNLPNQDPSNPPKPASHKYPRLLLALLAFHTIAYILFRFLDKGYQTWDSAGHVALSMKFAHLYSTFFEDPALSLYGILTTSFYYPPLMHMLTGFLFLIFGKASIVGLIFVFSLFLLSIILFYKLVIMLGYSPRIAFFTSFFYSFIPIIADQSRLFHTEIPTFFLLISGCICLFKSEFLARKRWVYMFFFVLGLGQMLKWVNAIYLFIPFLYVFYHAVFVQKRFREILPTLVLGSFLFFILWLPWFILNYKLLTLVGSWFAEGEIDDPQVLLSFENIIFYLKNLFKTTVFPVPMLGAFVGFYFFLKDNRKIALWFGANFALVYGIFTYISNKNPRYIMGIFLMIPFLIAYGLEKFRNKVYLSVLIFFTVLAFLFTSFNNVQPRTGASRFWGIALAGTFYGDIYGLPEMYSFSRYKSPIEDVLSFISKDASSRDIDPVGVASLIDTKYMASSTQEMLRAKMEFDKMYFGTPYYKKRPFDSDYDILSYLSNKETSYVIVPSGEVGPDNLKHKEVLLQTRDFILAQGDTWYEPIKTFDVVDNQVTVYRRNLLNKEFRVGTCRNFYEVSEGKLTLPMDPMASLIFFTSSFSYSDVRKDGTPNTIQVLEINNPSMERELRMVSVENLPQAFTVCHRMGTEVKVQKEFYIALLESENSCGINQCEILEHTKISDYSVEQNTYSFKDFLGLDPASRLLKRVKVLPLYNEIYTLENDIIKEFEYR